MGEIALELKQPEAARDSFAEGLKRFPDGTLANECRFGLGRSLERLGDTTAAIPFLRFLSDQETGHALSDDALLQLGILYYRQEQFGEAITPLQQLLERFPGTELVPHAAYWLGMSQSAAGEYQTASRTLSAVADENPTHSLAPAMNFAAGEALRLAQEGAQAESYYQRVIDQWPASEWADDSLQTLVQMAWQSGQYERTGELAERFTEVYPQSPLRPLVMQILARAAIQQGDFARAIDVLEPIVLPAPTLVGQTDVTDVDPHGVFSNPLPAAESDRPVEDAANRYYLALAYLAAQRQEDALRQLDQLAALTQPRELVDGVLVARASALLGLGRFEDAVTPLQAYLHAQPSGPDAEKCRAQLAVTLARLGRWPESEELFAQLRDDHADEHLYLSTVEYLAEAAYSSRLKTLAEKLFRELAHEENPPEFAARGLSGLAWLQWNREGGAAESVTAFERLLQKYPDSPLAAEAAMMRGQGLEKSGKSDAALAMYRLVIERYSGSSHVSSAILASARIHDQLQQDQDAEPLLRDWLQEYPDSDQRDTALYQLAWVLVDLGRDEEADTVFDQLRTQHQDSRYWADATYRLAERAARAGDHARADQLAAEVIDARSQDRMASYAMYLRGQLAAAAERWPDVVRWMQQLNDEYPQSPLRLPAEYWIAEAYYRQKQYPQAGEIFDRLDKETVGRSDLWLAMIPLRRAQVRAHQHQWDDAYDIAVGIAERFPGFQQQHEVDYLLGRYFMSRAEFDQARKAYQRVIRSNADTKTETAAMAQWMIGETYFMEKKYNQAIKAYHRVEVLYSYPHWQAAALLQAGKCQEMIGHWSEAIELYSQIVRDYAATGVAAKANQRLHVARQRAEIVRTR